MEPILIALSLALIPIYTFASGGVQISHLVLALLIAIRLIRSHSNFQPAETVLLTLFGVIMLREAYANLVDDVPLLSLLEILYIAFACLVVITFSRLDVDQRMANRGFTSGLLLGVTVAIWGIWYYGSSLTVDDGDLVRSVGMFNNPNQLAYFAICVFSIASLMYLRDQLSIPLYVILIGSSLLLVISSISKAGLISVCAALPIAISAILNKERISGKLIVLCIVLSGIVLQVYSMGVFDDFYFVQRLEGVGSDTDDNLASRGYRLPPASEPIRLLFGLGQSGVVARIGHEVHSTFWSFMLKYGFVGFGLFMFFWFLWARRMWRELGALGLILVVAPASFYGLTHNGSRFAILWILIGLSVNGARAAALAGQKPAEPPPMPFPPHPAMPRPVHWQPRPRS